MEHAAHLTVHRLIEALGSAVLLWGVGKGALMRDLSGCAELVHLRAHKLAPIVTP